MCNLRFRLVSLKTHVLYVLYFIIQTNIHFIMFKLRNVKIELTDYISQHLPTVLILQIVFSLHLTTFVYSR